MHVQTLLQFPVCWRAAVVVVVAVFVAVAAADVGGCVVVVVVLLLLLPAKYVSTHGVLRIKNQPGQAVD